MDEVKDQHNAAGFKDIGAKLKKKISGKDNQSEMGTPGSEGRGSVSFKGSDPDDAHPDDSKNAPAGLSSMKQSGENTSAFTG